MRINLNADLGESFGAWSMGDDAAMLDLVGSVSVACGFHAGDPLVMRNTVRAALARGVSVGAHPGFLDLQGFGRREMHLPAAELEALILYQLGALAGMLRVEGGTLSHVKPHGALSNMACRDAALAATVARAVARFDPALILLAPACSELARAGTQLGLKVALEAFADRAYLDNGELVPRSEPGAVLATPEECVAHAKGMLEAGGLVTRSGALLPCTIHSLCVHGDDPHAVATAHALAAGLREAGWELVGLPDLLG